MLRHESFCSPNQFVRLRWGLDPQRCNRTEINAQRKSEWKHREGRKSKTKSWASNAGKSDFPLLWYIKAEVRTAQELTRKVQGGPFLPRIQRTCQFPAAEMGESIIYIRHIELLGFEKRFFPSQHYVSTWRVTAWFKKLNLTSGEAGSRTNWWTSLIAQKSDWTYLKCPGELTPFGD